MNDAMKEFQIRVKDGSKGTSDAMAGLSKDTQNVWKQFLKGNGTVSDVASTVVAELQKMDDQVLAGQLGVGLFGTKWEDLESTAMYAMLGSTEAMEGFEGAMAKVNEVRFDTFGKAVQGIGRILFMDIVYPIGEAVLPTLNLLANYLSNNLPAAIEKTKTILKTITPVVLGMVSAFLVYKGTLVAVAVAQAIFNAVQKTSIVLYTAHRAAMVAYGIYGGGLKGVIQGMAAAMRVLNVSMLANPFVAVAAAVVGLGVAFYTAYKMSDSFRVAVDNAFVAVKNFIINSSNYVASNAFRIWDRLIDGLKETKVRLVASMQSLASDAMSFFGEGISGKVGSVIDGFISSFKTGLSSLPGIISMVAPMMTTLGLSFLGVSGPVGWLIGAIVSIGGFLFRLAKTNDGVASSLSSAWASIQTAFAPVMQVLSDGIADFAASVGPQLSETMTVISQSISDLAPSFATLAATLGEVAVMLVGAWAQVGTTLISTVLPLLLQVFQTVFPAIVSVITTVIPIVIGILVSIIPIILQIASMVIPLILQVVQTVFPLVLSIIQAVLPIFTQLLSAVAMIILTLAQTVIPILLSVVQMVFPIILSVIQMVIPIIAMVMQTLITIIQTVLVPAINGILAVVQLVFPYVQMVIENALAIVNGIIQTAMALLKGDWDGAWNAIKGTAETIMNNIISFFQGINLFEVGKSIINGLINGIKSMGSTVLGAISSLIPEPIRGAASKLLGALPGFAEGGVVAAPTLAWIGEGGDTESVIPWNNSQRSKDLWMQTGQALGMLDQTGAMDAQMNNADLPSQGTQQVMNEIANSDALPDMRRRIELQQEAEENPVISSEDMTKAVSNNSSTQIIELNYNPQYNVNNPEDLEKVKEFADRDKDDVFRQIEEQKRDKQRRSFG